MTEQQPPNNLRVFSRYITDHNNEGHAVFHKEIPDSVPPIVIPTNDTLYLGYATNQFPNDMSSDLHVYKNYLANPPPFTIPGGTVLSVIDLVPGATGPLHRTNSLDYGVVIEGIVELILDSGEKRSLERGDVVIQRGTLHQWRNASQSQWARVLFILMDAKPVEVNGQILKDEFRSE